MAVLFINQRVVLVGADAKQSVGDCATARVFVSEVKDLSGVVDDAKKLNVPVTVTCSLAS